jgi:uncharacterized protein
MKRSLPGLVGTYQIFRNDNLILKSCEFGPSFWFRSRGLLGKSGLEDGTGILLSPCNSVHMFFMAFPIDVIFLDQKCKIIRLCPDLRPWRFSPIVWKASAVVETGTGVITRNKIKLGEQLRFERIGGQ